MKTFRQLLLDRHQSRRPDLDSIRHNIIASLAVTQPRPSLVQHFWTEAVLPWRRLWLGLSAVWLIIISVSIVSNLVSSRAPEFVAELDPQTKMLLAEQRREFAELLGPPPNPITKKLSLTGPRSEFIIEERYV